MIHLLKMGLTDSRGCFTGTEIWYPVIIPLTDYFSHEISR